MVNVKDGYTKPDLFGEKYYINTLKMAICRGHKAEINVTFKQFKGARLYTNFKNTCSDLENATVKSSCES